MKGNNFIELWKVILIYLFFHILKENFRQNLEIFVRIWVFVGQFKFFRFWGKETETNPPESIFCGEDPRSTAEVVRSNGVELNLVNFFGWVKFLDGFGQLTTIKSPYVGIR